MIFVPIPSELARARGGATALPQALVLAFLKEIMRIFDLFGTVTHMRYTSEPLHICMEHVL